MLAVSLRHLRDASVGVKVYKKGKTVYATTEDLASLSQLNANAVQEIYLLTGMCVYLFCTHQHPLPRTFYNICTHMHVVYRCHPGRLSHGPAQLHWCAPEDGRVSQVH